MLHWLQRGLGDCKAIVGSVFRGPFTSSGMFMTCRVPVSWPMLFLVHICQSSLRCTLRVYTRRPVKLFWRMNYSHCRFVTLPVLTSVQFVKRISRTVSLQSTQLLLYYKLNVIWSSLNAPRLQWTLSANKTKVWENFPTQYCVRRVIERPGDTAMCTVLAGRTTTPMMPHVNRVGHWVDASPVPSSRSPTSRLDADIRSPSVEPLLVTLR